MPTYAIGDVHGCSRTLDRLLALLPFDERADRLWLVGDLVAHGPDSAGVLRKVRDLSLRHGDRVTIVLGNHDLRLIAARAGTKVPRKVDVLLDAVRAEPDGEALLDFLAERPLLHVDGDHLLVHAGLLPGWTVDEARERADEVASILASPRCGKFFRKLYDKRDGDSDADESDGDRSSTLARAIHTARVMTTIRMLRADGSLSDFNAEPEKAPAECRPWFADESRAHRDATVVFGHWAALGLRLGEDWIALDSGCAWGGPLTAVRLDDRRVFQTPRLD